MWHPIVRWASVVLECQGEKEVNGFAHFKISLRVDLKAVIRFVLGGVREDRARCFSSVPLKITDTSSCSVREQEVLPPWWWASVVTETKMPQSYSKLNLLKSLRKLILLYQFLTRFWCGHKMIREEKPIYKRNLAPQPSALAIIRS